MTIEQIRDIQTPDLVAKVSELKQELDVTPVVQFVEAGSLPVTEGKAKRVIDLRAKEK